MEAKDKEGGRILVETGHSQSVSVVKTVLAGSATGFGPRLGFVSQLELYYMKKTQHSFLSVLPVNSADKKQRCRLRTRN